MDSFPTASSISTDSSNEVKLWLVIKAVTSTFAELPLSSAVKLTLSENAFRLTS